MPKQLCARCHSQVIDWKLAEVGFLGKGARLLRCSARGAAGGRQKFPFGKVQVIVWGVKHFCRSLVVLLVFVCWAIRRCLCVSRTVCSIAGTETAGRLEPPSRYDHRQKIRSNRQQNIQATFPHYCVVSVHGRRASFDTLALLHASTQTTVRDQELMLTVNVDSELAIDQSVRLEEEQLIYMGRGQSKRQEPAQL